MFEPCYDSYVPSIESAAARRSSISLRYPDYAIPWDEVRAAITPRTRMIMINSPHNPPAAILGPQDLEELARIVEGTGDHDRERRGLRAHHLRRHAPREHGASRSTARAHLHRRIIRQDVSRHRLEDRLRRGAGGADDRVQEGAPVRHLLDQTPIQYALAEFVAQKRGYPELPAFYQRKRDLFLELLAGSRWKPLPSRGTYFQLLDYSAITG